MRGKIERENKLLINKRGKINGAQFLEKLNRFNSGYMYFKRFCIYAFCLLLLVFTWKTQSA